ncbi:MAG TPA: aspartate aminotransferase family protein [Methylomirabilota bacterium]|jgi:4-aminobutyrate aminotransferase|nr:aspartate aminotransferase family protein [Methylomirabilota bacterium]
MAGGSFEGIEGDLNLSPHRAEWTRRNIGAETQRWLEEDSRYFLHQALSTPCLNVLARAEGSYLEDLDGRRYLDFHGNSVHQVGFGNPAVVAAIKAQLDALSFCTRRYTNVPAVELARTLARITPGSLAKSLFCPSGAAAVGMALRLARAATGRHKTLSMWDSFHGASLDASSVGGERMFRGDIGPLLPGTEHVPPPDASRCALGCGGRCDLRCAGYLEYVLEREGDVAAVIAEPVRSTPAIPHPEYWPRVRAACDRAGALLIFDEIPQCLGRTGRMFVAEHWGVVPDILVLGKGLGGGILPMAAIVARPELDVMADRALGHFTHEKNPLTCAAALATIEYIENEGLVERARQLGLHALGRMNELARRHRLIGEVRGLGLLMGLELIRDPKTRAPASEEADRVMYRALERGLSFKVSAGNVLTLTPPLTIGGADLDRALAILDECLGEVENG